MLLITEILMVWEEDVFPPELHTREILVFMAREPVLGIFTGDGTEGQTDLCRVSSAE